MLKPLVRGTLLAAAFVPALVAAQAADTTRREPRPRVAASALIDARRELDLTPRQLEQLDALERAQVAERVKERERLRAERLAIRGRDSTARAAAERLLTDTQRAKLTELRAERRGYARGMRDGGMRDGGMRARGMRDRGMRDRGMRDRGMRDRGMRERDMRGAPGARGPRADRTRRAMRAGI